MSRITTVAITLSVLLGLTGFVRAQPLGTAFTFQGEMRSGGTPASGLHDLRLRLYDAASGGAQVGATLCVDNVSVTDGRFAVEVDFGGQFAGQQRFLEIEVREDTGLGCGNLAGFVPLSPRQALTATPNAAFSLNAAAATNATQLNGQSASFYLNASNLNAGTLPDARLASIVARTNTNQTFTGAMTFSNAANSFFGSGAGLAAVNADTLDGLDSTVLGRLSAAQTWSAANTFSSASNSFTGSGAGLTALSASNVGAGTLADARLSANVVLLHTNQTFTGGKAFSTAPAFTAAGAPFTVTSGTLVTNLNADRLDGLDSSAFLQTIPVPLTLSGSSPTQIFMADNAASDLGSSGVRGRSSAASGLTYGVVGVSDSTAGRGVAGQATAGTGAAYGVQGASASVDGRGVYGTVTAISGSTFGGYFEGASTAATGAFGLASAGSGSTTGLWGQSNSTSGRGVYGLATAATGTTTGVYGWSDSTSGRGVFGYAGATTGDTRGVFGVSESSSGRGVFGHAVAPSGTTYGVYGQSDSTSGYGLYATATAGTGVTRGVSGRSSSTSGRGVYGYASAASGATIGGEFLSISSDGTGVRGSASAPTGATVAGDFDNNSTSGIGVRGVAGAASGTTYGGSFQSNSTSGYGVFGLANAASGITYGGYFQSNSTNGFGVFGRATAGSGSTYGGRFENDGTGGIGVYGIARAGSSATYGVYGRSDSADGRGVYGHAYASGASDLPYGVRGFCSTATSGYAVYAVGDLGASGAKPFRIDHPFDPENKYLLHYSVESPEVLNAYSGKVTLDGSGEAVVELPAYFASINKDPRYTLTAVGAPMPLLHVAEEISEEALKEGQAAGPGVTPPTCSFRIAGGVPGAKVSWEVKALRNDLRIRLRGAPIEREKAGPERGRYQHPEYYGLPPEKGMDHAAGADRP